jgi:hypothetical protein
LHNKEANRIENLFPDFYLVGKNKAGLPGLFMNNPGKILPRRCDDSN